MSNADPPPNEATTLPAEIEAALFDILLAAPAQERDPAVRELAARHPTHAAGIERMARAIAAGERAFAGTAPLAAVPATLGPYRLLDKLGQGSFGVVYLAEQKEPIRRRVAVKLLVTGLDSAQALARFEAERQALALLEHPNIARVLDAGVAEQVPYVVMEHVPGEPITRFCDARRLDLRARLRLFVQVCTGVQHAHHNGIIHRDLKPSNILVVDGETPAPKIIDFGIAKAVGQRLTEQTLRTEVGALIGTPEYMSPEQTGSQSVDARADVHALGVLLYELLCGTLPFEPGTLRALDLVEMLRTIREVEPPLPKARFLARPAAERAGIAARRGTDAATLARQIDDDLDCIVQKAIAKDREQRYATVSELAADVRHYLEHEPVAARPPSRRYRAARFARRHRKALGAATVMLALLVGGGVSSTLLWIEARHSAAEARGHLADFDRLSDLLLLSELERRAEDELWPELPERLPAIAQWLGEAEPLAARLPEHRVALAALARSAGAAPVPGGEPQAATRAASRARDPRQRFLLGSLGEFVDKLAAFTAEHGTLASVAGRRAWAERVVPLTLEAPRELWRAAAAAVAADARFAGLVLEPQVGLVPLGPDPDTRLQEFTFVRTGKPPAREAAGRLRLLMGSALVLVLVPGGETVIGAQSGDPAAPHHDPAAQPDEGPVHAVRLEPFFLAKHEMTQAQWWRCTGTTPSSYPAGTVTAGTSIIETHPVESVSWVEASRVLAHLGLVLPSEAQWEHACRAGTGTPWPSGKEPASLQGHANLADEGSVRRKLLLPAPPFEPGLDDGFGCHAPIGSFAPNAFGLHDMTGNVSEWCAGVALPYARAADDESRPASLYRERAFRGGNFLTPARLGRSSARHTGKPEFQSGVLGVRPARPVLRSGRG